MKNIYMVQPTFMNTNSVYLPYAVGSLVSYAWDFSIISENYNMAKCFFLRDSIDKVLGELEDPFLVGFSCYMWNFEYNLKLAEKLKEKYPNCIILFGGQHLSPNNDDLKKYSFIDILIQGEGELAFKELLEALVTNRDLKEVNNLVFWENGEMISTPVTFLKKLDFSSPYQNGFFDKILEEYPDIDFIPLIETNRGCPNKCSYCSWGLQKSAVRLFSMERVFDDIKWVSDKKMEFLGFADANFGLFPRDEEITDKIIELKEKYGYPKKFQVSYAKDCADRVYRITKKLNKYEMDKGVTLSFQSMSQEVQNNIGRSNMYIDSYRELLKKYADDGIPTYTDLILGLPGETVKSFADGFEMLLEYGQHTSLFVHLCEWLPRAEMGNKDYMDEFGIEYKKSPLCQPHSSVKSNDLIQEHSRLITRTKTMSEENWIEMNLVSTTILSLHHLGLLQYVALYLFDQKGIKYIDFYKSILDYFLSDEANCTTFKMITDRINDVIYEGKSSVIFDDRFGNIAWPFEEYVFLDILTQRDIFYEDIKKYLKRYNDSILDELLSFQMFVLKNPEPKELYFDSNYDFNRYCLSLRNNKKTTLEKKKTSYSINGEISSYTLPEFAKQVLWFGRRGGKNIYTTEIETHYES